MLFRNDLNQLREKIISDIDDSLILYSPYSSQLVIRSVIKGTEGVAGFGTQLSDYEQDKAENRIGRLNPLLNILDPSVATGQMSIPRALSIYSKCMEIGET